MVQVTLPAVYHQAKCNLTLFVCSSPLCVRLFQRKCLSCLSLSVQQRPERIENESCLYENDLFYSKLLSCTLLKSHCEVFCRHCKLYLGCFFFPFGVKRPLHELRDGKREGIPPCWLKHRMTRLSAEATDGHGLGLLGNW